MTDIDRIVAGLSKAQKSELRQVQDDDMGYLARGDQAGLVNLGLAVAPHSAMGFYRLTATGLAVRARILEGNSDGDQV